METLKFKNLPNAVAELQKGQSELKALLLQKAKPQPEVDNPITIPGVSKLDGVTIIIVLAQRKKSFLTLCPTNFFKIARYIYRLFKILNYLRLFFESIQYLF
ncbi:hypothetical protein ACSTS3_04065 [Aquimarina muelleri]|uniref:hypothetical protein n=1 Tax=Aquimarina muelleri TaxID=279356 RepID=UPI003F68416E